MALSLLAHPDDAEILCAGTLCRLRSLGWDIHIATATAGDCGTATLSAEQISAVRKEEAAAAARIIGATYHCLEEKDVFVCYNPHTTLKAVDLMRAVCPTIVFTHAPRDYMMDHEQISAVARAATFGYSCRNVSTSPLRPGALTRVPWLYYCDPLGGVDPLGQPVTPTTVIDISSMQSRKLEMLACHVSQREWLQRHHGIDEYLDSTRRHDASRGALLGVAAAEAFVQHRGHAYPANDLLAELLGPNPTST